MHSIRFDNDFASWRDAARVLLHHRVDPNEVEWLQGESRGLFGSLDLYDWKSEALNLPQRSHFRVARNFMDMAYTVSHHRDPDRWQLLYQLIFRLAYENPRLLDLRIDEAVSQFSSMEHQVRRDAHKAKAFVRFRKVEGAESGGGMEEESYVAWHEPEHLILPYVAPFFKDRFSVMDWTILTPDGSVRWNKRELIYGPGFSQNEGPQGDQLEDLWGCYYKSIFNPARVKVKAMKAEMPKKYWHSMPETRLIEELLFESDERVDAMLRATPRTALDFLPEEHDLTSLKAAFPNCQACELCAKATQGVFGVGPPKAKLMMVGEQPGDQEDLQGLPFVGPAGEVLEQLLNEAGLSRSDFYMTNSVKAFKHRKEGKRRIHEKPTPKEVGTCKPWLQAEMAEVDPTIVLCLGLTAALSVLGQSVRLIDVKNKVIPIGKDRKAIVTHHPAHILRITDPEEKEMARDELLEAIRMAGRLAEEA